VEQGESLAASIVACVIAWAIGGGLATAQQVPRACTDIGSPPVGLELGQPNAPPNVIGDGVQFVVRQRPYSVQTFADTAPSGRRVSEWCFRYEAENTGLEDIRRFYWPLAGMNLDPLNPGRRTSRVQTRPILEAPIDIVSSVFAFENEKGQTRAYAERQYREAANRAWAIDTPRMALIKPDVLLPGLSDFLKGAKLPSETFFAVYLNENETAIEAPALHDRYTSSGLDIDVSSSAVRAGKQVQIQTTIKISGEAAESLQYSMPALRTWEKFDSLTDLKAYTEFVALFGEFKMISEKNRVTWNFKKPVPVDSLVGGAVYRMDHPVYASSNGRRECIIVASYAPAPLSFDLESCRTGN
jgi:hypothetical protein